MKLTYVYKELTYEVHGIDEAIKLIRAYLHKYSPCDRLTLDYKIYEYGKEDIKIWPETYWESKYNDMDLTQLKQLGLEGKTMIHLHFKAPEHNRAFDIFISKPFNNS